MHDGADGETEEAIDPPHPLRVAGGEVVVHGDDVDAETREGVEVDRQGRHQGLALAGAHLGDAALVQHHAADQLHVEVALAEHALGSLAHGGEGGHEDVVEGLAGGELGLQHRGPGPQIVVRERGDLRLQGVDLGHTGTIALHAPVVGRAENLLGEGTEHREPTVDRKV